MFLVETVRLLPVQNTLCTYTPDRCCLHVSFAVEKQFQCPSSFFEGIPQGNMKGKDLKFVSKVDAVIQQWISADIHTQSKRSLCTDCKDLYSCMGNVRDAQP